jgi:hypothetical protein
LRYGLAIPVETEPCEAFENGLGSCISGALTVGVFNAQQHFSAIALGIGPVEQGRARTTNMEISGG